MESSLRAAARSTSRALAGLVAMALLVAGAPAGVPAGAGAAAATAGSAASTEAASGPTVAVGTPSQLTPSRRARLATRLVGAAPRTGGGYWILTADGGVHGYGAAREHGQRHLHGAVAIAPSPDGRGYWVATASGHVFAFGDARWAGSAARHHLGSRVVAMVPAPGGAGYWLVTARGRVLAFGHARYDGSAVGGRLHSPVVGMALAPGGAGYWLVTTDGTVLRFGNAPPRGSGTGRLVHERVTSVWAAGRGYVMLTNQGRVLAFGAPLTPPLRFAVTRRLPPSADPPRSLGPPVSFGRACLGSGTVAACNAAALAAIDAARASEGYGPLRLPGGFSSLGAVEQLLVVANAERTTRHLPAFRPSRTLDGLAHKGALSAADPTGPAGYTWDSNIAWGYKTPLAADFGWMYDDGVGSPNVDCHAAGDPGCWGHRHNILSPWSGAAGTGAFDGPQGWAFTQVFVDNY
ncbi:MAG: CAP domain-containing protein [Acidimicrobiales bacterium]